MLTKKQNLLETIRGGNPDRYVNGYEALGLILDPIIIGIGGFALTMKSGETMLSHQN